MKLLLAILLFLSSSSAFAVNDNYLLHATTSYAITFTVSEVLETAGMNNFTSALVGGLVGFAFGATKELIDDHWEPKDFEADSIGIGAGVLLGIAF